MFTILIVLAVGIAIGGSLERGRKERHSEGYTTAHGTHYLP
jgi:hypothetical protein